MKIISTRVHGVLDYLVGALLIASPWLFDFARGGAETWVPVVLGAGTIIYSLLTDYELGVSKTISMKTHLGLDAMSGVFLAISPWLFGFNEYLYLPHLILGILELGAVWMTNPVPAIRAEHGHEFRERHRHAH
ncbi:MAG TPA: SPW repeat protein [Chryseosolibacter sp.]|nr:SPW repeat protein [Chryseosolibacter sp.]